ncbi:MAG: hypothetical protein Q8P76_02525 [bacterium]|nr:hypothetical protein [bacterium]
MENNERKISTVEAILAVIFVASADLMEFLASLLAIPIQVIPVVGQGLGAALMLFAWLYGFTVTALTLTWIYFKGLSMRWFLGGSGLELIPGINALPLRTAAILAVIAEDRLPLLKKASGLVKPTAKSAVATK